MSRPIQITRPIGGVVDAFSLHPHKFPLWFYDPQGKKPIHLYMGCQFYMGRTPDYEDDELQKVIMTGCGTILNENSGRVVAPGASVLSKTYKGRVVCHKCYAIFKRWYKANVHRKKHVPRVKWDADIQKVRDADGGAWFDL